MKKIRKLFNGYINLLTVLTIMAGIICAVLSKNLNLLADWTVIFVFFLRMISLEKVRDTQHKLLVQYRDTIKLLDEEVNRLKSKEGN